MGKDILSKLTSLVSGSDVFKNPYEEIGSSSAIPLLNAEIVDEKELDSKKVDKDSYEYLIESTTQFLEEYSDAEMAALEFDSYIEGRFQEDEDSGLTTSLVSLGRKYARDTEISAEASEITKAFSANKKLLIELLRDIEKDKDMMRQDINSMRMMSRKNFKALSDLYATKTAAHNAALSTIKELNSVQKTEFELQNKMAAKTAGVSEDGELGTARMIQEIMKIGRGDMMSSVGGYGAVSGSFSEVDMGSSPHLPSNVADNDEMIQKMYFQEEDDEEDDGAKFIRYEKMGVELILLINRETGDNDVIAEDKFGNHIVDYPLPTNISELTFDVNEKLGTATDDFHRVYKLRYV